MRSVAPVALMVVVVLVVGVLVVLGAGPGVAPTEVMAIGEAPRGIARRSGQGIYLVSAGRVRLVVRPGRDVSAARAVRTLLAGPTAAERAHRLTTRLPELGTGRVGVDRASSGVARVRLPGRPGRLSSLAVRQIACTVGRATLAAGLPVGPRVESTPSVAAVRFQGGDEASVLIFDARGRRLGAGSCPELAKAATTTPALRVSPSPSTAPSRSP